MRRFVMFASCLVLALGMTSDVKADVASDFWGNVLNTVNPDTGVNFQVGETIRLVFISSGAVSPNDRQIGVWDTTFGPSIPNIDTYYQNFANTSAAAGLLTSTMATTWTPLTNTTTNSNNVAGTVGAYGGLSVFNASGQLVANQASDMLGGSLVNSIKFDESGDNQALNGSVAVWTGSAANGNDMSIFLPSSGTVNATLNSGVQFSKHVASIGNGAATNGSWLNATLSGQKVDNGFGYNVSVDRSIYVMSGEITVVPEPSTILMWLGFTGIAGMVYWRKRRS